MKVAVVQRICPPYRVEVFRALSRRPAVDLTLFYGRGAREGFSQNAGSMDGLESVRLFTLAKQVRLGAREYYPALHPSLTWHLWRLRPDVILAEGTTNLLNNIALAFFCRITRTPLVLWDAGRHAAKRMGWMRALAEPVARSLLRRADACVGYGRASVDYFLQIGVNRNRAFLAPNSVDLKRIQEDVVKWSRRPEELVAFRSELGIQHRKVVLHIGSLHVSKPLDPLIRAIARLQGSGLDVGLLVIGDGPDSERLRALSRSEGLHAVHFAGRVTEDLGRYALISDVAVFPATATLGVLTALAYGVPAIAGRDWGVEQEAIREGVNGFLLSPGDEGALAALLARIVRDEVRFEPASAIRESLCKEYGIERMIDGILGALGSAVGYTKRTDRDALHVRN